MNKPVLGIIIEDPRWEQKLPAAEGLCNSVFAAVLDNVSAPLTTTLPLSANLALSNDEAVHLLNFEFRGFDKPTNVLSFANIDDPDFDPAPANASSLELGDIIIALETLEREANEKNISLADHFCHLLAHGLLHLLGYDHQEDDEAEEMEILEIKILQCLEIKNPYEE